MESDLYSQSSGYENPAVNAIVLTSDCKMMPVWPPQPSSGAMEALFGKFSPRGKEKGKFTLFKELVLTTYISCDYKYGPAVVTRQYKASYQINKIIPTRHVSPFP